MKLSESQVNQFIKLYRGKYGVVLERSEAIDMAIRFMRCIELVESNNQLQKNKS